MAKSRTSKLTAKLKPEPVAERKPAPTQIYSSDEHVFLRRVGRQVAAERVRRDMSQKDLAVKLGISNGYLALIEVGRRNAPLLLLRKLSKALNVRISTFVDVDED